MAKEYSTEELWRLFKRLPEELKDWAFSLESAEYIELICKRNGIEDEEKMRTITKLVGETFFGLLPPENFQEALEKELSLEKERAKEITLEIERFLFWPVRNALQQLYKGTGEKIEETSKPYFPQIEKKPEQKPKITDKYREPIE